MAHVTIDADKIIWDSVLDEFRQALVDTQHELALANGKLKVADRIITAQSEQIGELKQLLEEATAPPAS